MHMFHGVLKMNSELGVGKEQYCKFQKVFMPINKALLTSTLEEEEKNWAKYKECAFIQPPGLADLLSYSSIFRK